jgi:hypothetical protein
LFLSGVNYSENWKSAELFDPLRPGGKKRVCYYFIIDTYLKGGLIINVGDGFSLPA